MTLKKIDTKYVLDVIGPLEKGEHIRFRESYHKYGRRCYEIYFLHHLCMFNSSITNGVFLDIYKIVGDTPIHKSGSKSELNHFLPISVISVFAMVLERLVLSKFHKIVSNILKSSQAAFLGRTDHWEVNMDNNKMNRTIFLD